MTHASALVCTRNRAESLLRAITSLLTDHNPAFEVIVMDQSDDSRSEEALAALNEPRLRFVRSQTRGKGAALNEGLRLASGHIVVCTDDDCEVPIGWVLEMARALEVQQSAAILFCRVSGGPYDRTSGYVPAFDITQDRLLSSIRDARHGLGLGAGMALRREAVLGLGAFDESFGPGARFPSGDDWDISLRALLKGWHVYETADLSVLHHGFRSFEEGRRHAYRDFIAIGALCAKPIRAGYCRSALLAIWIFSTQALWPPLKDVLRMRRPSGRSRISGFARGFIEGMRTPVDRQTICFRGK